MSAVNDSDPKFASPLIGSNRGFFITASLLLILSLCSARVFITQYTEFKQKTREGVTKLLLQKNLPLRDEQRQVIVSSVLRTDEYRNLGDVLRPTADNVIHAAFAGLSGALFTCGPEGPCDEVAKRIMAIVAAAYPRKDYPDIDPARLAGIAERIRGFKSLGHHEAIASCDGCGVSKNLHELQFGSAGCDPPPGRAQTTLLIPSRENHCADRGGPPLEDSGDPQVPEECFTERVRAANDLSLVLEDLAQLLDRVMRKDVLRKEEEDRGRLVQVYFISPDSLLRYWSQDRKSATSKFASAHLWGATPFIQIPLERFEKFPVEETYRRSVEETFVDLSKILADALEEPYLDYGEFGLVKTKCTPVLGDRKRILGVVCSDVTVPPAPRPGKDEGWLDRLTSTSVTPFLADRTIVFDPGRCVETLRPLPAHEEESQPIPLLTVLAPLCTAVEKEPSEFFQKVQTLNLAGGETVLAVPLGQAKPPEEKKVVQKEEGPRVSGEEAAMAARPPEKPPEKTQSTQSGDMLEYTWRRVLLLKASAPQLPHGSLAFLVFSVVGLFTVLGLRIYFERSHRARDHEDTLLRDLQVGVLDVSDGHVIEAANDRAEELLGTRLPTLGAKWDIADPRMFFDFVEDRLLIRNPDSAPEDPIARSTWREYLPLSKEEVRTDRRLGLSYEYYAKLKRPVKSRRGRLRKGAIPQTWLRVRGSPILTSKHLKSDGDRTFAVIHSLNRGIEDILDRALETVKADEAGRPS